MDTKVLKDKILQLAIQGKLVAQDENDEPASVLLEKIKEEKEKLIKDKVIKKGKLLPEIREDEKPFALPYGWEWLRVKDIGYNLGQEKPSYKFTYIDVASIDNKKGKITKDVKIMEQEEAPSRARKIVKDGTVIYSTVRPYLMNIAIVDNQFEYPIIASTAFATINCYNGINNKFIYYYLRSNIFKQYVDKEVTGTAYPAINEERFNLGLVPIPPQHEQDKIVSKLESIFKLIDILDDNKEKLSQDIYDTRNKILQLAIQGKLVCQSESDEPASVLLEKIKEEKERLIKDKAIKKEKPLAEINDDEKAFDIPNGWEWCRLGDIVTYKNGYAFSAKHTNKEKKGLPVIKSNSIMKKIVEFNSKTDYVKDIDSKMEKCFVEKGDLLMCLSSQSSNVEPLGITALYEYEYKSLLNQRVLKMTPLINSRYLAKYLLYCINSVYFHTKVSNKAKGSAQSNLKLEHVLEMEVPLPPLEEQKRIVNKINIIMNYLDTLEKQIN